MRTRFGVNAWVWDSPVTTEVVRRLAPRVAEWGYDLLEIPIENLGDWHPGDVRASLNESGLGATVCGVFGAGRELCGADASTIRSTQDYLLGCLEHAAAIGAGILGGPFYSSVGRTWRVDPGTRVRLIDEVQRNLAPIVARASDLSIHIAVEPLNRYETSLINTVEQALQLLEPLDPTACGILIDTYHANIEERSVIEAIERAAPRLVHLQASASHRGTPGDDHIDWNRVADELRRQQYSGAVVVESFTAANEAIATAASIWRPLAPSQDALAVNGLMALQRAWAT